MKSFKRGHLMAVLGVVIALVILEEPLRETGKGD